MKRSNPEIPECSKFLKIPPDIIEKKYDLKELNPNIQALVNIYYPLMKTFDPSRTNAFDNYFWVLLKLLSDSHSIYLTEEEKIFFEHFAERKLQKVIKALPL